jgi:hypothetical protein
MELVERYLQAVRYLLPKRQRDDVARELSDDLRSQIEDKESGLGRRLTEDETAEVLKGLGHPLLLALRYQQGRSLIGPEVFPLFAFAVKSILGVLAVVHIVLPAAVFLLSGEPSRRVVGLFVRFPGVAVQVLGWVTLAFVVIDTRTVRSAIKGALAGWRPQSLPDVVRQDEAARPPSATDVVLTAVLSVWWLAGLAYPPLILGPSAAYVDLAPGLGRLYAPIAASALASIALGWFRLSHPRPARVLVHAGLVSDALALSVLFLLTRVDAYVVPSAALVASPAQVALVASLNDAIRLSMQIALIGTALAIAWKYVKHFR